MDLYIHRPTDERVELRVVDTAVTIAQAVGLQDGEHVRLEETEEVLDVTLTIAEAEIPPRAHVHVSRCHKVEVTVHFNGTKEHTFPPSTRVERVFDWATGKHGFNLTPTDRTEHVLEICGTTVQPDDGDHIGSFAREHCEVCFNLVPKHRFEG
jgi:hypothetical protein